MSKKKVVGKALGRGNRRMLLEFENNKKIQISLPLHLKAATEKEIVNEIKLNPYKKGHLSFNRFLCETLAARLGIPSGYRSYEELNEVKK